MKQLDVVASLLKEGKAVKIPVRGNSMRPYLVHDRDFVILQQSEDYKVGDSVFAEISSAHYVLHRIVKISGQHVTLRGDGNFATEYCEKKDVYAKAIAFQRKGQKHQESPESMAYRLYSWFWMNTLPLRRYLLFAHHLIFNSRKVLNQKK